MAIDLTNEPPGKGGAWGSPQYTAWSAWRDTQWGKCTCGRWGNNPFDDCVDGCERGEWEKAYEAHHTKAADALKATLGVLTTYLTPLTAVHDLAIPSPAYIRSDGETVLPEGKLSALHGMPSIGKSFVALDMARAVAQRGGRVVWWDFEDTAETLRGRCDAVGFAEGLDNVYFALPSMVDDIAAMKQAALFVNQGEAKGMVVIDAVNSAGCPSDGSDVSPWFASHVHPFGKDATVLLLDHIPKRSDDRAPGAIGSTHKRSVLTGVSLLVEGRAWTCKEPGRVTLRNHKDRHGVLPVGLGKVVATITGETIDGVLTLEAIPPSLREDGGDVAARILEALTEAGEDGIKGKGKMRKTVAGKGVTVDAALADMEADGLIDVVKEGAAIVYRIARREQ